MAQESRTLIDTFFSIVYWIPRLSPRVNALDSYTALDSLDKCIHLLHSIHTLHALDSQDQCQSWCGAFHTCIHTYIHAYIHTYIHTYNWLHLDIRHNRERQISQTTYIEIVVEYNEHWQL